MSARVVLSSRLGKMSMVGMMSGMSAVSIAAPMGATYQAPCPSRVNRIHVEVPGATNDRLYIEVIRNR
jgi:hypothetical protein